MMILNDQESDLLRRMFSRGETPFQDERDHVVMHGLRVKLLEDTAGRARVQAIQANTEAGEKFPFS